MQKSMDDRSDLERIHEDEREKWEARAKQDKDDIIAMFNTKTEEKELVTPARIDVPKWSEGQTPATFFQNFEDAMIANGENCSRWARLVLPYLSERARQVYHTDVPDDMRDSYSEVKYRILSGLGDTPQAAATN